MLSEKKSHERFTAETQQNNASGKIFLKIAAADNVCDEIENIIIYNSNNIVDDRFPISLLRVIIVVYYITILRSPSINSRHPSGEI